MKKRVLVLGATGSIGSQTLDIVRNMSERFEVCGLAAGKQEQKLRELCEEFNCRGTVFSKDGEAGLIELIKTSKADIAVNGVAGSAGLLPSILVLRSGIDLALANKETVVMAWNIVKTVADENNAFIIPVDSEHSAIFNLIRKIGAENIKSIVLTASGGPFRNLPKERLKDVTVDGALKHPTWKMGEKITVDSATLANKGLEVIEAARLFGFDAGRIQVVIHPQSLIHSLVRTKDGMLYAQISDPDMRHSIFSALVWPDCEENYLKDFDLSASAEMTFSPPDPDAFPLLGCAYSCVKKGGAYPIAFNAANEVAALAFLERKCSFTDIFSIVQKTLESDFSKIPRDLREVYEFDAAARKEAERQLSGITGI